MHACMHVHRSATWTPALMFVCSPALLCEGNGDLCCNQYHHSNACLLSHSLTYSTGHSCTPTHSLCFLLLSNPQLHLLLFHLTSPKAERQRRWRNVEMLGQVSELIPRLPPSSHPLASTADPVSPASTEWHRCFQPDPAQFKPTHAHAAANEVVSDTGMHVKGHFVAISCVDSTHKSTHRLI